ncbi:MAG: scaffolding protein [Clostridiales bacterium]|nr:scaffolding protein [Clostridiales bacterium]
MERKFLEDLGLEKDTIDKIMAENGKDIEAEKAKIKVETEKLTKANETIKSLQETVKKFDGVDVEKLKKDLADAETKYNTELSAAKLNYALEARLAKEGAVNSKAVKALLDKSKISLDGDNLIGIDEQLKVLKEKEKWAFTQPTPDVPGVGGNPPPTPQNKPPLPSGTVIF